jgi:hypothetical protein
MGIFNGPRKEAAKLLADLVLWLDPADAQVFSSSNLVSSFADRVHGNVFRQSV